MDIHKFEISSFLKRTSGFWGFGVLGFWGGQGWKMENIAFSMCFIVFQLFQGAAGCKEKLKNNSLNKKNNGVVVKYL